MCWLSQDLDMNVSKEYLKMVYTYCTGISSAGETEGRSTVCRSVDSSGLRLLEFLGDNENGEDSVGDDSSLLPIPKYELLIGERGSGGGKNPAILIRFRLLL